MAAKFNGMGLVLCCTLLLAQGARAENCRLSISQSRIDYGLIRREATVESPSVALGTRTVHLNVICAEPSAMALRFTGAADGQGFRFGREGHLRLTLRHAQVDGRAVGWELAHLPGETASGQFLPGRTLVAGAAGKRLTAQVDIDPELPSDALHVRDQSVLEGLGRFELISPAVPLSR